MTVIRLLKNIPHYLTAEVAILPLATFRVVFGALTLFSTVRFYYYGWIEDFYLAPRHFFSYFGQDWILPYGETFIYSTFIIMALSALGIMLGLFFRVSSLLFFLSFTYVELIDKTTYLNHYYFVSLMAFLLLLTPAHRALSIDAKLFPRIRSFMVPKWSILALQCQIAILYFFAGLAKLNYDWLFKAQPMNLWLKSKADFPILGDLFVLPETAFIFSWTGMLFDICIAFLLFSKKLRPLGYLAVVIFHLLTWFLFPIGVFPWVMIGVTLIFFSGEWHGRLWALVQGSRFEVRGSDSNTIASSPLQGVRGKRGQAVESSELIVQSSDSNTIASLSLQGVRGKRGPVGVGSSQFAVRGSKFKGFGRPFRGLGGSVGSSRFEVRGWKLALNPLTERCTEFLSNVFRPQEGVSKARDSRFEVRSSKFEVQGSDSNPQINPPHPSGTPPRRGILDSIRTWDISNLKPQISNLVLVFLAIHFLIQLALPIRHAFNDENLYWTENGYRFSWRVMLMEKTGHLEFRVKDIATQKESIVSLSEYFTAFQQRQLVTQPDMILQAAHIIAEDYATKGLDVEVYADSYASLNGNKHQRFVDPDVNLAFLKNDRNRDWIMQYE